MAKEVLADAAGGFNLQVINRNFTDIETALNDKVLYRDNPAGEPNQMKNLLDMNAYRIINLAAPQNANDAARLGDIPFEAIPIGTTTALLTTFTPASNIAATNVQAAIEEVSTEIQVDNASTSDVAKGDALVGVKRTLTDADGHTLHARLEHDTVIATVDFSVPNDGTSATTQIEDMFDACATQGVKDIFFPSGTYLLPCNRTDSDYTCAVVVSGLKNCRVHGAKDAKFIVDTSGSGPDEYGMFRVEQCENVEFFGFEMDGSGIVIDGTGANRSRGFVITNFNVNAKATDLAVANKNLTFHNIHVHDIGGFVGVPPRSANMAAAPYTDGLVVRDCTGSKLTGQDHFVATTYCRNVLVSNNKVVNALPATAQVGNLFADMSAGTINALVENNYAVGFTGGGKAETHINQGAAFNEDRPSYNVCFRNNNFLEMGDPITMVFPGPGGGGFYGIKLNGINHSASKNTITARTTNRTTGGLYQGIQLVSTVVTPVDTIHTVEDNDITGTVIGINHDSPTDPNRRYVANIIRNKVRDTYTPASPVASNDGTGILVTRNALVENNDIYRTPYAAIMIQTTDQTIVRKNFAYNCTTIDVGASASRVVYYQAGSGAQGYFEYVGNIIVDDRGGSAAEVGYYFEGGTTYSNKYIFIPGYTTGLLTSIAFDKYISAVGNSLMNNGVNLPSPRSFIATGLPSSTAPWNGIAWNVGDRAIFNAPAAGTQEGWVCTVAGTPGTWIPFGINKIASAYTVTNPSTDRAINVSADTTAQVAAVLGTLITDLQNAGVLS